MKINRKKNTKIDKTAKLIGECVVGKNCQILGNCRLENVVVGENVVIENSSVKDSKIGDNCKIGPYANIRENCTIGNNVKIGSFVELKNVDIGKDSKIPHLAYVGDAKIGERVNIGCGVVFANFDGIKKHFSFIGSDVFVGCNVNIISPVTIADNTYICAGTTVTKSTEKGDFVIGRVRQENKKR